MGASGSTLAPRAALSSSPLVTKNPEAEEDIHFYDSFRQMKSERMSDEEIYNNLKRKYVHGMRKPVKSPFRNDTLQNVALYHFSQTLETNRLSLDKSKRSLLGAGVRSQSYEKLDRYAIEHLSLSPLEKVLVDSSPAGHKPRKELTVDVKNDNTDFSPPPSTQIIVKPTKKPQLTICVDSELDNSEEVQQQQQPVEEGPRTPRVDGHISPSGAVHVGRFAINEHGLRSEMTGREFPHAFLTTGKSDFVEIGFLGSGASSSIIEALHIPTLTIVALKMLPAKDSSDLRAISSELSVLYRNLAELHLIDDRLNEEDEEDEDDRSEHQTLSSPCEQVLALYDAFLDAKNGMVNLVVEYMDGGSLQDLVDHGGCQDEQVLADIAHQGLLGLDFLHGQNCVHRDIKPGNILVNCAGIVKIADFGVAKAMDINFEMNKEASFVGTMCYMAPERMMSKTYGVAADVWSFGLTLLAVVLGKYPLLKSQEKSNYWDLMKVICDQALPRLDNSFSHNLQHFLNSCLHKNPDERASVKELLRFPLMEDLGLPAASQVGPYQKHGPLSAFTEGQVTGHDATVEGSNAMLVKFAHLETVLEKVEMKYQLMVALWKRQGHQQGHPRSSADDNSSYRSISARSCSMKTPTGPVTRLPNFVSGLGEWKHLAAQLHLPLDMVLSTASTIINSKYFAKLLRKRAPVNN